MGDLYGHRLSGIFGYSHLTLVTKRSGCRVPNADLTCVKAPKDIDAKKLLGLADVTTTAWHGCELAEVGEGDVVGVWGCGPIHQKLILRGAKKVYAVDIDTHRLALAEKFGMIPVDANKHKNPGDYILSVEPRGLDRGIEASGFRSTQGLEHKIMRTVGARG